jgi:hypothetical protein
MQKEAWFALLALLAEAVGIVLPDTKSDEENAPRKCDPDFGAIQQYILENFGR